MKSALCRLLFVAVFLVFLPGIAGADPYGDPVRANLYTAGNQIPLSVATGANGDTAIIWNDIARGAIFMQRYDGAGRALQTDDWYVGTGVVDIAVDGAGNYAVLRTAPDGSGNGVFVAVYSRAGSVLVPEFRVNDTVTGDQTAQAIAMNANGQFAVVWTQPATGTPALYVKRFQANGAAVAPQALAASYGVGSIYKVDIAIDGLGNFVTTWDYTSSAPDTNVFGRRFGSNGLALAGPFRANTYVTNAQGGGRIAMNDSGAFVIVWTSYSQQGSNWGVHGQRYNAAGTAVGGEFQISTQTSLYQEGLAVAMAADGSFTATWHDDNRPTDPTPPQVRARSYAADGTPIGDPFLVSTASDAYNAFPEIGMDRNGNFVIGWRLYSYVTSDYDAFIRRYSPAGILIQPLTDGVPVTNLSGAAGSWQYFKITVPPGNTTLDVSIAGTSGDADLYVRYGALPNLNQWDGRPWINGSNEAVSMQGWPAGDWYIGINGYSAYSGLSLQAHSH